MLRDKIYRHYRKGKIQGSCFVLKENIRQKLRWSPILCCEICNYSSMHLMLLMPAKELWMLQAALLSIRNINWIMDQTPLYSPIFCTLYWIVYHPGNFWRWNSVREFYRTTLISEKTSSFYYYKLTIIVKSIKKFLLIVFEQFSFKLRKNY